MLMRINMPRKKARATNSKETSPGTLKKSDMPTQKAEKATWGKRYLAMRTRRKT